MQSEWVPGAQQSNVMRTLYLEGEPVAIVQLNGKRWTVMEVGVPKRILPDDYARREEAEFAAESIQPVASKGAHN